MLRKAVEVVDERHRSRRADGHRRRLPMGADDQDLLGPGHRLCPSAELGHPGPVLEERWRPVAEVDGRQARRRRLVRVGLWPNSVIHGHNHPMPRGPRSSRSGGRMQRCRSCRRLRGPRHPMPSKLAGRRSAATPGPRLMKSSTVRTRLRRSPAPTSRPSPKRPSSWRAPIAKASSGSEPSRPIRPPVTPFAPPTSPSCSRGGTRSPAKARSRQRGYDAGSGCYRPSPKRTCTDSWP